MCGFQLRIVKLLSNFKLYNLQVYPPIDSILHDVVYFNRSLEKSGTCSSSILLTNQRFKNNLVSQK